MQIHICAQKGDIAGVSHQIASGVDIDCIDQYLSQTPLMWAVMSPSAGIDMIQFLVENGANVNAIQGESQKTVLSLAIRSGNLDKIRFLLDAGANINCQYQNGCDVFMSAMCDRDTSKDQNLISILNLLLERGAKPGSVSSYGESALKVVSRLGRFDAVKVLLAAGDDLNQLKWTALMQAITFGSLEEVKTLLDSGADLFVRDHCNRTPWLLSLQVGEVAKAKLLLSSGADRSDRGCCEKVPLMYAIENNRAEVLEWLIKEGFDIEATDDSETTLLMMAAECGATECVAILLENSADPSRVNDYNDKAIKLASNLQIVRILVQAGEDLSEINHKMRQSLTGFDDDYLQATQEQYLLGRYHRFGRANPEVMEIDFWKAMVRCGASAYHAQILFNDTEDNFDRFWNRDENFQPIWCHNRYDRTITELPDGRIVEIGGAHEDSYDPDFCIYNDVVVYQRGSDFKIFGYPKEVFPPIDAHTATLVGNYIYIIGNLGYFGERIYGETPVYKLDCDTFKVEKIETTGDKPGWIFHHKTYYKEPDKLCVTGGEIITIVNNKEKIIKNLSNYALDLMSLNWSCTDS